MNLLENKGDLVKIGISAAIIILAVYVYFAFSPSNKNRIQVYVVPFNFGTDPAAPISSSNPADPKSPKDYVSYEFSDYSGKVQVLVHPNNATIQPVVSFKPSPESLNNKPYLTWLILSLNNPTEEALSRAYWSGVETGGYQSGTRRVTALLRRTGLSQDQTTKIAGLNENLLTSLNGVDGRLQSGLLDIQALAQLKQILNAFINAPGDPNSPTGAKADLARKVLAAAKSYAQEYSDQENKIFNDYLNNLVGLLTDNQKQMLAQSVAQWIARNKQS